MDRSVQACVCVFAKGCLNYSANRVKYSILWFEPMLARRATVSTLLYVLPASQRPSSAVLCPSRAVHKSPGMLVSCVGHSWDTRGTLHGTLHGTLVKRSGFGKLSIIQKNYTKWLLSFRRTSLVKHTSFTSVPRSVPRSVPMSVPHRTLASLATCAHGVLCTNKKST